MFCFMCTKNNCSHPLRGTDSPSMIWNCIEQKSYRSWMKRKKKAFLYNFLVFSMEFYRLLLGLCGSGCGVALFRPKIFLNAQSPYKVWLPFYHSQKLVQHLVQMTLEICWAELGGSQSLQGTEQTYPLCLLVSAEPLTFTTIHLRA